MKFTLRGYQTKAVTGVIKDVAYARTGYEDHGKHSAVVLQALTGAGKTVMAAAIIEQLFEGGDTTDPRPNATVLWVTDSPDLNTQTMKKMIDASDGIKRFQVITAGKPIDQETFDAGTVYFLNIQACRKGAEISTPKNSRNFTIWDTVRNTVRERGGDFLVFLDEAHRGVEQRANNEDATIVNKLINDPKAPVPVVIGISATTDKFDKSLVASVNGEDRIALPNRVKVEDVKASGIVKDRVVVYHPDVEEGETQVAADTTLVREGVRRTLEMEKAWDQYTTDQNLDTKIVPALVIQVENEPTQEYLREVTDAILSEWPNLTTRNIINTFADHTPIDLGGDRYIKYMAPHLIHDTKEVRVVFAKSAITTGWDCPRAEVLVSLRTAKDPTLIAQLIGRTVRQPLARRVDNELLNQVFCFLPKFDRAGVEAVVGKLNGDDAVASDIVRGTLTFTRDDDQDEAFKVLESLPSYIIPSQSPEPGTRRLRKLAKALADDGILHSAVGDAEELMVETLTYLGARRSNNLAEQRTKVSHVDLTGLTVGPDGSVLEQDSVAAVAQLDTYNIDAMYRRAARTLPDGVAHLYWSHLVSEVDDDSDAIDDHKVTVAALGSIPAVVEGLQDAANKQVDDWLKTYARQINNICQNNDERTDEYQQIRASAREPALTEIEATDNIVEAVKINGQDPVKVVAEARANTAKRRPNHLFVDVHDGHYYADFNDLERDTLALELPGATAWYRNPPGGKRALRIPYEKSPGVWAGLHPDFITFTDVDGELKPSIVDPHSTHQGDTGPKLKGIIKYAKDHPDVFYRINAIDRIDDKMMTLQLHLTGIQDGVLAALESGSSPKDVFRAHGVQM